MPILPRAFAVLTAALLLLLGAGARADEPTCGPYTLAFYEHGILYSLDATGHGSGIDLDVARELSRRSGCQFIGVLESRARTWDQFRRNALDLTLSAIASPEREKLAEFVPYLKARSFVVTHAHLFAGLPTAESFLADQRLRLVVVKSFSYGTYFDAWVEQLRLQRRVVEASDFNLAARLFEFGRADAILASPFSLTVLQKSERAFAEMRILRWPNPDVTVGALAMSLTRVVEPDRQRLRAALGAMLRDGTVEAIVSRYVGVPSARALVFGERN